MAQGLDAGFGKIPACEADSPLYKCDEFRMFCFKVRARLGLDGVHRAGARNLERELEFACRPAIYAHSGISLMHT